MAAYLIAHLEVSDPKDFDAYRAAVSAVVEKFGGSYLVRGGGIDVLEGHWPIERLVIIAFDSPDQARRFYASPEYQEILPLRLKSATGPVVIADGV